MCYSFPAVRDGRNRYRERRETKMKKKLLILLLIVLIVCLLAVTVAVRGGSIHGISIGGYTYDHAERYNAGDAQLSGRVSELDVSWIAGGVNIDVHSGSDVRLSETADRALKEDEMLRWWLDGEKLCVKYAASGFRGSDMLNKQLTILLPEGWLLDEADINVVSADVQAEGLAADVVRMNSVSGDVYAVAQSARKISISTVSGNATVEAAQPEKLEVSTVSGDAHICLPEDTGFTADVSTISGSVSGTLPMQRQDGRYISGDGHCRIDISTVSGDVKMDGVEW